MNYFAIAEKEVDGILWYMVAANQNKVAILSQKTKYLNS